MVPFRGIRFVEIAASTLAAVISFLRIIAAANPLDVIKDEGCQAWWTIRTTYAKGLDFKPAAASEDGSEVCVGLERGITSPPKLERPKLWGCFDTSKCGDIKAIELPEGCESLPEAVEEPSKKKKTIVPTITRKSAKDKPKEKIYEPTVSRVKCLSSRDSALKLFRNYCPQHCVIVAIDKCRKEAEVANDVAKKQGCPDTAIKDCKVDAAANAKPCQAKRLALKRCFMMNEPPNLASIVQLTKKDQSKGVKSADQGIAVGKCGENWRWGVRCMDDTPNEGETGPALYKRLEKAGYSVFNEVPSCPSVMGTKSKKQEDVTDFEDFSIVHSLARIS